MKQTRWTPRCLVVFLLLIAVLLPLPAAAENEQQHPVLRSVPSPVGYSTNASAINEDGLVVGFTGPNVEEPQAFVFDSATSDFQLLEALGPGTSAATDINNAGVIVGEQMATDGVLRAFAFDTASEEVTDLGNLGGQHSRALAINDSGLIVGESQIADGSWRAFVYDSTSATIQQLGGADVGRSVAYDINNDGHVVGSVKGNEDQSTTAVLFEVSSPDSHLALNPDEPWSTARVITDSGHVYGDSAELGLGKTSYGRYVYGTFVPVGSDVGQVERLDSDTAISVQDAQEDGLAVGVATSEERFAGETTDSSLANGFIADAATGKVLWRLVDDNWASSSIIGVNESGDFVANVLDVDEVGFDVVYGSSAELVDDGVEPVPTPSTSPQPAPTPTPQLTPAPQPSSGPTETPLPVDSSPTPPSPEVPYEDGQASPSPADGGAQDDQLPGTGFAGISLWWALGLVLGGITLRGLLALVRRRGRQVHTFVAVLLAATLAATTLDFIQPQAAYAASCDCTEARAAADSAALELEHARSGARLVNNNLERARADRTRGLALIAEGDELREARAAKLAGLQGYNDRFVNESVGAVATIAGVGLGRIAASYSQLTSAASDATSAFSNSFSAAVNNHKGETAAFILNGAAAVTVMGAAVAQGFGYVVLAKVAASSAVLLGLSAAIYGGVTYVAGATKARNELGEAVVAYAEIEPFYQTALDQRQDLIDEIAFWGSQVATVENAEQEAVAANQLAQQLLAECERQAAQDPDCDASEPEEPEVPTDPVAPEPEAPTGPKGSTYGEPHVVTFDGLRYSFQAEGEFVLTRSTVDDFTVQVRYTQTSGSGGRVSITTAVAVGFGGDVVQFDVSQQPVVNGETVSSTSSTTTAGLRLDRRVLTLPDGTKVSVSDYGYYQDVEVELSASRTGAVEGLLANADGQLETSEDIPAHNDTTLYGEFGPRWVVPIAERLLPGERMDYAPPGRSASEFVDQGRVVIALI